MQGFGQYTRSGSWFAAQIAEVPPVRLHVCVRTYALALVLKKALASTTAAQHVLAYMGRQVENTDTLARSGEHDFAHPMVRGRPDFFKIHDDFSPNLASLHRRFGSAHLDVLEQDTTLATWHRM